MENSASAGSPAVSVIVPFLNCERFLDEAIRSVRSQPLRNFELLLVDDGSSDGSARIAAAHRAEDPARIRYLQHHDRGTHGSGASRDLGIRSARGRYLAFLDADDIYEPQRLQRHVELLDRNPDWIAVQGLMSYWHSWQPRAAGRDSVEPPPLGDFEGAVRAPGLLVLLMASHGASAPGMHTITTRASVLQGRVTPAAEPRAMFTDQVLVAHIYLAGTVGLINQCDARYRQHGDSVTRTTDPRVHREARRAFLSYVAALAANDGEAELLPLIEEELSRCSDAGQSKVRLRVPLMRALRRIVPPPLLRWRGNQKLARRIAANLRIVQPYIDLQAAKVPSR
jgi:glycosyltransferase involved in cell wall biosynthesis